MKPSGNTMLFRLYDWERNLDFQSVRVKNEALNPTGTFKDRRSEAIIEKARKENIDKLVLISAGNAAYSLVQYAREADIAVSAVVSETLTDTIKQVLRTICADVIEVDLSKKVMTSDDLIALARRSPEERIMDVTNGFHDAYRSIVRELKKNIRDQERPDAILMPFGGGEAMTGVMNGVSEVGWRDSTMVYGIHNRGAERLKTSFLPYRSCKMHGTYAGRSEAYRF
jgi:cysteine synthase